MACFLWEGAFLACIIGIFQHKNNENIAPKFPCAS
jgi:hypothetical protein